MSNRYLRLILLALLCLGLLAALASYLYINAEKYKQLLHLSVIGVIALLVLAFTFPVFNGFINIYMFQSLSVNLSYPEGFLLAAAATLANQLPLPGGILARGMYLKKKHGLSYTQYFGSQLALFLCAFAINGFLGLGVLIVAFLSTGSVPPPILLIAFTMMAATILVLWLPLERITIPAALRRWTQQALQGWTLFSHYPVVLLKLIGLEIITTVLLAMRYWVAFHMLSQNVTMGQVLLFSCASILTQLISFLPGGLGVREAIVGGIALVLGFDFAVSVAAVGLDRLVSTVVVVLVGGISTVILGRIISETPFESGV